MKTRQKDVYVTDKSTGEKVYGSATVPILEEDDLTLSEEAQRILDQLANGDSLDEFLKGCNEGLALRFAEAVRRRIDPNVSVPGQQKAYADVAKYAAGRQDFELFQRLGNEDAQALWEELFGQR